MLNSTLLKVVANGNSFANKASAVWFPLKLLIEAYLPQEIQKVMFRSMKILYQSQEIQKVMFLSMKILGPIGIVDLVMKDLTVRKALHFQKVMPCPIHLQSRVHPHF